MAMATAMSAALALASTIASASTSLMSGFSQSNEAKYNAGLYQQQAGVIDTQKGIEAGQYERAKRQLSGTTIARTAKSGLMFSGSPAAVMVDSLSQLEMDKQVGQYNLEVQKRYSLAGADVYNRRASTLKTQGYMNAFSTILKGGFDYSMRSGWLTPGTANTTNTLTRSSSGYGRLAYSPMNAYTNPFSGY